jgi:putative transposase
MPLPRKRLKRYEIEGQPRLLTFSCFRRMQLLGVGPLRDAFACELARCRDDRRFLLHAWVVMPEHVHLLITPHADDTVEAVLYAIKRSYARIVIARWRTLEAPVLDRLTGSGGRVRFWQPGGGYDRNIKTMAGARPAIEYIHGNPVRRSLAPRPCDWAWSSARWYEGRDDALISVDPLAV